MKQFPRARTLWSPMTIAVSALTATLAFVIACGGDGITGPGDSAANPTQGMKLSAFVCSASVRSKSIECSAAADQLAANLPSYTLGLDFTPEGGRDAIIIGGQHQNVDLTSSNVAIDSAGRNFSFDVSIKNLRPQPIGTLDGVTTDSSLSVFIASGPTTASGTGFVSVANATGVGAFTSPNQPYFKYGQILAQSVTSSNKNWVLHYDPGVLTFTFLLYVSASVKYPNGYVDVYPQGAFANAGGTLQMTDSVRDALGVSVADQSVTWEVTDSATATINSSGLLSGVAPGSVNVIATHGARTGQATVSITGPPTAVVDSAASNSAPGSTYHVAFNTPLTISAPGVMGNDTPGYPAASLTFFGADSLGGAVTDHAAGTTVSPLPGHADGSLTVASTGALTFTPPAGFTGYYAFHYRIANVVAGTPQTSDALVKIAVGVRPSAAASTYTPGLVGNVPINTSTSTGFTVTATGDAPIFAVTANTGGVANVHADKTFEFTPTAGFTGAASFTFTVKNGFGTSSSATVGLTVGTPVWFVNASAAAGGDGRKGTPFNCLVGASGCFNGSANLAGQVIYVASGTYSDNATLSLKATQRLIGQAASGVFATLAGITWPADAGGQPTTGGAAPVISPTAGTAITLNSGNTVKGLRILSTAGAGITGASIGTLDVANVAINVTGGPAIDWASGTASATIDSARSTNSTTTGVNLSSVAGTITVNGGTASAITNPTGAAVSINGSNPAFTFPGTISKTNASGVGINLASMTGGSAAFSGPSIVISSGASNAINITSSSATVSFVDSVRITTTTGSGINATSSGTLAVAGTHNTIASTGGIALNVSSTTIGAAGLNFRSISATGGANGIVLSNTGTTAGLTVTGDGSTPGSGGTITNMVGSNGAVAGNGVYLSSTKNASLSWMAFSGHQNNGLYGIGVRGLTINKTRFTGTNGDIGGTFNESDVHLVNVGGPVKLTNSRFDGAAYNAVRIENITGTAPTLDSVVVAFDTVATMQGSTADVRGDAILLNLQDGTVDARFRNNQITVWWGNAIHALVDGTASGVARITNNFADNTNGALAGAGGIWIAGGNLSYNISSNTVRHTNGTAISADRANTGSNMNGTIDGNTIGVSGDANSGSATGIGIYASHTGPGTTTIKISNNVLRQINGSANGAISTTVGDALAGGGSGTFNATISSNNIQESGTTINNAQSAILITHGVQSGPPNDTDQGCYNIASNVVANFNTGAIAGRQNLLRVNQRFGTTSRWPGYTGAATGATSQTDMGSYLLGRNTASFSINANTSTGGFLNTSPGGSACPQPSM
jgi:hypothetical protein